MPRKLKHHEQKLLKKVNLYEWKENTRNAKWHEALEHKLIRQYRLQKRDTFRSYLMLSIELRKLSDICRKLNNDDPIRTEITSTIMTKLHHLGLLKRTQRKLTDMGRVHPGRFCKRRLACVVVELKMAPTIEDGIRFIEQGHIRVGPDTIVDPDFLVSRSTQDYVTWVDSSKIREKVLRFNQLADSYSILGN